MISERVQRSQAEIAELRALHARQREEADHAVGVLLKPYGANPQRASLLRAAAASALDHLAEIIGQASVASLCCALSTHFVPEIASSARAKAEALFIADDQEAA